MLEEYLKRLENLITPRSFSLTNFNDKKGSMIIGAITNPNIKTSVNTDTYDSGNLNANLSNNQPQSDVSRGRLNTTEGEILPENFREVVHQLKIKNMNYRHTIHILNQKIEECEKQLSQKDSLIKKMQKQKEDDNKYLLKLEGVRAKDGVFVDPVSQNNVVSQPLTQPEKKAPTPELTKEKSSNKNWFSTTNNAANQSNINFNESNLNVSGISEVNMNNLKGLNLNDKKAVKEFAIKIMAENKKLKNFQTKVYEVSRNYDTLNEKITSGLRVIKKYFEDITHLNSIEGSTISLLASKLYFKDY